MNACAFTHVFKLNDNDCNAEIDQLLLGLFINVILALD